MLDENGARCVQNRLFLALQLAALGLRVDRLSRQNLSLIELDSEIPNAIQIAIGD